MSGLFAIFNHTEAATLTSNGLYALQELGVKAAGIVCRYRGNHMRHGGPGLVVRVFTEEKLRELKGRYAIGQVSPQHGTDFLPRTTVSRHGAVSLCMEGRIFNAETLRSELRTAGVGFQTTSDAELVLNLIAHEPKRHVDDLYPADPFLNVLLRVLKKLDGAYAMLVLHDSSLYALTDPAGVWPLSLGEVAGSPIIASETLAFDLVGARYLRSVIPGEVVCIKNVQRKPHVCGVIDRFVADKRHCAFEMVRKARPDSLVFDRPVYEARLSLGMTLARAVPVPKRKNTIVVPVPNSGMLIGQGYAQALGLPFMPQVLIRNHYPIGAVLSNMARMFETRARYNPICVLLRDAHVILVDAVMYSAETMKELVAILRALRRKNKPLVKKIHVRIAHVFRAPCPNGYERPLQNGLFTANHNAEELRVYLDADSVGFLSADQIGNALDLGAYQFCTICVDGKSKLG